MTGAARYPLHVEESRDGRLDRRDNGGGGFGLAHRPARSCRRRDTRLEAVAHATDEWWAAWRHRWGDLSAYPAHSGTCPTGRPNVSPNSPHVGSDRGVVGCSLSSCDYPCRRLNFPKRVIVPADADAPPAGPVAVRRVQPVPRRFEVARAARRRRGRRVCGAGATRDPAAPRVRIPSVRRTRRGAGRSGPGRAG